MISSRRAHWRTTAQMKGKLLDYDLKMKNTSLTRKSMRGIERRKASWISHRKLRSSIAAYNWRGN